MKSYYVYILASDSKTLYVGVTNNLEKRILEHKNKLLKWFTEKYWVDKLVFYEVTDDINSAISREKQLKNWHREWKVNLIEKENPDWEDLSDKWWK